MSGRRIAIIAVTALCGAMGLALLLIPNLRADHMLALYTVVGAPLLLLSAMACGYALGCRSRHEVRSLAAKLKEMAAGGYVCEVGEPGPGELGRFTEALNVVLGVAQKQIEAKTMSLREEQIRTRVLQADKQHMEAVLNSIADAVLVTNAFGDVTLANGAAESALDFRFEKGQRQPLAQIIDDNGLLTAVEQLRCSERLVPRKVLELDRGSNGETRTYKTTISAVRMKFGEREELSGLVAVFHDVTREREVARLKNDFVSKVTHELRTPLSSIRAYVEMLVDGEAEDPKTQAEFYKIIDSESDRLARMIDNILNISRIEAGVIKVEKKNLALTGIIKDAVDCLKPQAAEKDLTLEGELSPMFFQVYADHDMLYQAVLNVISNAIKYTPAGGRIDVTSGLEEGLAVVRVRDNGMGIPAEDLPHLFTKFYRVGANKKAAKGTGLGLALVKEIIETLHHGKVTVESAVGKGTTFVLQLPVSE